jgi:hypothetical protein
MKNEKKAFSNIVNFIARNIGDVNLEAKATELAQQYLFPQLFFLVTFYLSGTRTLRIDLKVVKKKY